MKKLVLVFLLILFTSGIALAQGPVPQEPILSIDPFYDLSVYDTGYCPGRPAGWGWNGRLSWPTDSHDVLETRAFRLGHPAIDILAENGSEVRAAATGKVIWAGYNTWGYGNLIILDHGSFRTLYAHLDTITVSCGRTVTRGAHIGTTGRSGQSSFNHLHFEVMKRNLYRYDPCRWLQCNLVPEVYPANKVRWNSSLH